MCNLPNCPCEEDIVILPATPSTFCNDVRNCENQQLTWDTLTSTLTITEGDGLTPLASVIIASTLLVADTQTVDLTLLANTLSADVLVSAVVGNTLTVNPDGLFVASGAGESTTVSDTTTVDLTLTGVDITADVIISPAIGNVLIDDGTGLFVPTSLPTVSDTTTVDLTLTGIDITADVIISPNGANALFDAGNGLYVSTAIGESTTVADTNSINLTMTGYQVTADVILDPSPLNATTVTASGVLTSTCTIGQLLTDGLLIGQLVGLDAANCLTRVPAGLVGQVATMTATGVEFQTPSAGTNFDITDGVNTEVVNSGDTITFQEGEGIDVLVGATDMVTISSVITREAFTGLVAGNTVALANIPGTNPIQVFRNGLLMLEGVGNDFTIAATTITFAVTFSGSETVQVYYTY